ncbi:MAG TPA: hypothetical protein VHL98_00640 [Microvirga sp.]|jgi:hypothetical protein|nr:hypothetical protein [Microvirga sp.]
MPQGPREPVPSPWLRGAAIGLGWIKAVLVVFMALAALWAGGQDRAGQGMSGGLAAMALLYLLVFVAPGLRLAYRGRSLEWSFALLLAPDVLLLLAIAFL